jgi:methyl coenzyme M reductase subunit C
MDNDTAIAIIPFSVRIFNKHYDSIAVKLDQVRNEIVNAIKSRHSCQISTLIEPIYPKNLNDLAEVCIRFVIWGPILNVATARKELLRCNVSEVILHL